MIQQNPPGDAIGHFVVLVGYDPVQGFKVKSTDDDKGIVEWIPEHRMTWYQYVVTEHEYEVVKYNSGGVEKIDQNGQRYFLDRTKVVKSLQIAHQTEIGIKLNTDFTQRKTVFLQDAGFVLKFKKICQCQGDTCKHTYDKDDGVQFV